MKRINLCFFTAAVLICSVFFGTFSVSAEETEPDVRPELAMGSVVNAENWEAPWGCIAALENGMQAYADSRYKLPLSAKSGCIEINLNIDSLWDTQSDITIDSWITLGFMSAPVISGPFDANTNGLHVRFHNQGGKLLVFSDYSADGTNTDLTPQPVLTGEAVPGKVTLKIEKVGEDGAKLLLNASEIELNGVSFAKILDADGCTHLSFAMFDSDVNDELKSNQETRRITLLGTISADPDDPDVKAAAAVDAKIEAIGEVTTESKETIDEARAAYDALSDKAKGYVCKINDLVAAENKYADLYAAENPFALDVIKDLRNWEAPWGGLTSVENGMRTFAHCYYKPPISMEEGVLCVNFHMDGLHDGLDTETPVDAWTTIAFVSKPGISAPGSFAGNGLCIRFNNKGGKLLVSVHYMSVVGEDLIAVEDKFADEFDAIGDFSLKIQKNGEGVLLFINGVPMTHEGLGRVFFEDLVDADCNTYIAIAAYDNDPDDALSPNTETRCLTVTGFDREKTESVVDATAPVIEVRDVPASGIAGTQVILPIASVTDDIDGELDETITVTGPDGAVNVFNHSFTPVKAGEYTVVYSAQDKAGNKAEDKIFKINVRAKEEPSDSGSPEAKSGCGGSISMKTMMSTAAIALLAMIVIIKKKRDNR